MVSLKHTINIRNDQQAIISFSGRLDASVVTESKTILKDTAARGYDQVAVNLKNVSFIDSSGLSALVSGFKAVGENGGTLVLANVGEQIRVALELTRLNQIFLIFESLNDALRYLDSQNTSGAEEDDSLKTQQV